VIAHGLVIRSLLAFPVFLKLFLGHIQIQVQVSIFLLKKYVKEVGQRFCRTKIFLVGLIEFDLEKSDLGEDFFLSVFPTSNLSVPSL